MTTTSNHVTSPAKTGKSLSLDEYKNLTGDRQLQQMIQSAVTSALGQMYLDNPIPDHSNTEKSTMSTIDAKMKRCCISTEYGNIWVQGKTIPQMCQAFHEKMARTRFSRTMRKSGGTLMKPSGSAAGQKSTMI